MAKVPYLFCRSGNWTFRRTVPPHLQLSIGKSQVWKSLGAIPHAEAAKQARRLAAEFDALVDAADLHTRGAPPTGEELRAVVRAYFLKGEHEAAKLISPVLYGPELAEADAVISEDQANASVSTLNPALRRVAKALAEKHRLAIKPGSPEDLALHHLLQRAEVERLERFRSRIRGDDDSAASDPLFAGLDQSSNDADAMKRPLTIVNLIEAYVNDPGRARSKKTIDGYAVIFRALAELLGEGTRARDVTRDDCRRIRDILAKLPPNATKRFKSLSLAKAAERAEREGLPAISPKAATSYLQNLSALFKWAVQEGYVDRNPAEALRVVDATGRTGKKSGKLPFDDFQLKAIFAAPLFAGCADDGNRYADPGSNRPRRGRFWVPLLSLFHGLRLNEACQLHVTDVAERDGVPVLLIRPEGDEGEGTGKRVKTEAGRRIVPIHPEVAKIGFMNYVEERRKAGDVRLFPDLPIGANGYASDPFSKWFARFLLKAGAAKPGTSFHSFRHRFRDALREADVPTQRARALGGWASNGGADALYGEGLRPSTLAVEIAKVQFPELDLSHLCE